MIGDLLRSPLRQLPGLQQVTTKEIDMATIRDRVLDYLRSHPEGADDGELTQALRLKNRAQANQRCHQLVDEGLVVRQHVNGRFRNYAIGVPKQVASAPLAAAPRHGGASEPWYWEGNVQSQAAAHLLAQGYVIRRLADTAGHEQGIDLVAEKDGRPLWVTVKGFPAGTARTQPSTQAGHWFKDALFDIIEWRGEDTQAELAMALPDYPRYRRLAEKVRWLQRGAHFSYLWVHEDGSVSEEHPDDATKRSGFCCSTTHPGAC